MFKPVKIKALPDYKLWIRYEDGSEGELDVSNLAGRGVFKLWNDYSVFEDVSIAKDGAIYWNEDVELCPDATYMKLTGKKPEEVFPKLQTKAHA